MSPKVNEEHKKKRRANILEAAKAVFIEHGYERVTMKHIMEAAGVSRGGLYQYFSNKEEVFETILEELLTTTINKTMDLLKEEVTSYWELLIKSMFGDGEEQPDDEIDPLSPAKLEYFIIGRNDNHRRKYGKIRYENGIKIYKEIIEQGQRSMEFSSKYDSEIIARFISSFFDGLALDHAILPKEDLKLKEQSILFVDHLKKVLEV